MTTATRPARGTRPANRRQLIVEAATELQIVEVLVSTDAQIKAVIEERLKKAQKGEAEKEFDALSGEIGDGKAAEKVDVEGEGEDSHPIIKLVNRIIEDAYSRGTSDIHIEPYEDRARVRYRIDGDLQERMTIPNKAVPAILSRLKIMSNLDIAERRIPQDGKIKFKRFGPLDIELRVATIPSAGGVEDIVMRILSAGEPIPLDKLGLSARNHARCKEAIEKPYGFFCVCGPTGSGKTTTLHSVLGYLNTPDTKIWTAEDPVEITQKGLRQVQMLPKAGLKRPAGR